MIDDPRVEVLKLWSDYRTSRTLMQAPSPEFLEYLDEVADSLEFMGMLLTALKEAKKSEGVKAPVDYKPLVVEAMGLASEAGKGNPFDAKARAIDREYISALWNHFMTRPRENGDWLKVEDFDEHIAGYLNVGSEEATRMRLSMGLKRATR